MSSKAHSSFEFKCKSRKRKKTKFVRKKKWWKNSNSVRKWTLNVPNN